MGRRRSFDEDALLAAAAEVFVGAGYETTSVDDLVTRLGVHRGSLYHAFGSKRGLFVRTLDAHVERVLRPLVGRPDEEVRRTLRHDDVLDLVLVAAVERGPADAVVASTVRTALGIVEQALTERADGDEPIEAVAALGARLYARLEASAPPPTEGEEPS